MLDSGRSWGESPRESEFVRSGTDCHATDDGHRRITARSCSSKLHHATRSFAVRSAAWILREPDQMRLQIENLRDCGLRWMLAPIELYRREGGRILGRDRARLGFHPKPFEFTAAAFGNGRAISGSSWLGSIARRGRGKLLAIDNRQGEQGRAQHIDAPSEAAGAHQLACLRLTRRSLADRSLRVQISRKSGTPVRSRGSTAVRRPRLFTSSGTIVTNALAKLWRDSSDPKSA